MKKIDLWNLEDLQIEVVNQLEALGVDTAVSFDKLEDGEGWEIETDHIKDPVQSGSLKECFFFLMLQLREELEAKEEEEKEIQEAWERNFSINGMDVLDYLKGMGRI